MPKLRIVKGILFASLLFSLALFLPSVSLNVIAQSKPEAVKVGVILPLSGAMAPIGVDIQKGLDFAVGEINKEGGIKSLKGAPLELVYSDSRGLPEVGMSETERLILRSGVSALLGAFNTAVTFTSTQVAEKYQTPYIVLVAVGDGITERGFKYTFRINARASDDSKTQARIIREQTKKQGIEKPRIALLYENSEWGQDCAKTQKEYLAKEGLGDAVVLDEKYNPGAPDLSRSAEKVKAAKPDVILLSCYLADGILLTKAFAQLRIDAMVFCKGAEHSQPTFLPAVGHLADYQLWCIPWHKDLIEKKPELRTVYNKYVAETKTDLTSYAAMGYANVYLLKDGLERAASTDRKKIRDALAVTNISSGRALMLPAKAIEFGPDGQCKHVVVNVMQTQNMVEKYVYPPELAPQANKMIWPAPPWSERKL